MGEGGSDPWFLWRICPHALRALKGDHSSSKSDNFPTKVFLFPQKPHLFNIFTLKNDLHIVSRMYVLLLDKLCQDSVVGQTNSGNARILGWFGPPALHPYKEKGLRLTLARTNQSPNEYLRFCWCLILGQYSIHKVHHNIVGMRSAPAALLSSDHPSFLAF